MTDENTGEPVGEAIRQVSVDGHRFEYYLMGLPGSDARWGSARAPTNHLMLYLGDQDGKTVADAQVRFTVADPGGASARVHAYYVKGRRVVRSTPPRARSTEAVVMEGGYGADLSLRARGAHRISAEVIMGSKVLRDEFAYTVE
ncbi:MAG: hypothetical protein SCH98_16810 [Deferrisomatales bacterium]|nr:hypothetical protein [Deferrisomatales bacterium]